jgi:hypothetical protein
MICGMISSSLTFMYLESPEKREERGDIKICEEIRALNVLKLIEIINAQSEAETKRTRLSHLKIKPMTTSGKKKILKQVQEKTDILYTNKQSKNHVSQGRAW